MSIVRSSRIPPQEMGACESIDKITLFLTDVPSGMLLRSREEDESPREPDSQIEELSVTYEGSSHHNMQTVCHFVFLSQQTSLQTGRVGEYPR